MSVGKLFEDAVDPIRQPLPLRGSRLRFVLGGHFVVGELFGHHLPNLGLLHNFG